MLRSGRNFSHLFLQAYSHPVRTNQIPRQVPDQPWYLHTIPCMLLAGILPFGAVFIELFFIFSVRFLSFNSLFGDERGGLTGGTYSPSF